MSVSLVNSSAHHPLFATVVLPLPLARTFTYRVPDHDAGKQLVGHRVMVPFHTQIRTGIILHTHAKPPFDQVKDVLQIPDSMPLWSKAQLLFFQWLADYYVCPLGTVIQAALGPLKAVIRVKIQLAPTYVPTLPYDEARKKLLQALQKRGALTEGQAQQVVGKKDLTEILPQLLHQKAITLTPPLTPQAKATAHVRLAKADLSATTAMDQLVQKLGANAPQKALLAAYFAATGWRPFRPHPWLAKNKLLAQGLSPTSLRTLIQKNILLEKKIPGVPAVPPPLQPTPVIGSPTLAKALQTMDAAWKKKNVILWQANATQQLMEVYTALSCRALQAQKQVLCLFATIYDVVAALPYFKTILGTQLGIYHGQRTSQQQQAVWHAVKLKQINLVVGTRSALFLPFSNLQYIIIDQEQDPAYKQTPGAIGYHARDAGIVYAQHHSAQVLLGSPTPSVESYYNAQKGKYGWVSLHYDVSRGKRTLALVMTPRKKGKYAHPLSSQLLDALSNTITQGKQAIVIHHRKGYALYNSCTQCAWRASCPHCNVSLTYHETTAKLECHYCNHTILPPPNCPLCNSVHLQHRGLGIQQLAELLTIHFPTTRIKRIDGDTIPYKKNYLQTIKDFKAQKIDILVGTQQLIKALPALPYQLVALLNIENWLRTPNFRAYEQCYQYLAQVVLASWAEQPSDRKVMVQASASYYPLAKDLVQALQKPPYDTLYQQLLQERKNYAYPPYSKMLRIDLTHPDLAIGTQAAHHLVELLEANLSLSILGPLRLLTSPKKLYTLGIWVKMPKGLALTPTKKKLQSMSQTLRTKPAYKHLRISFEVDPN